MIAYGIDFGTTNSSVAFYKDGKSEVLKIDPASDNPYVFRSVLYIKPESEEILFAYEAIEEYIKDIAKNEAKEIKQVFTGRYIKKDKDIIGDSGWSGTEMVPEIIKVEVGGEGRLMMSLKSAISSKLITNLNIYGRFYSFEKLLSLMIGEMKRRADEITGEDVKSLVLGRPVKYVGGNEDIALGRMREAARIAGFENVEFEFEPIGAAWDWGLETEENETIMVFDFGGGTLDLSVVKFPEKEIIANDGVPIGGDLLNSRLFEERISEHFGSKAKYGEAEMGFPSAIMMGLKNWYNISQLKTESFLQMLYKLRDSSSDKKAVDKLISLVRNNLGYALYKSIDEAKMELTKEIKSAYKLKEKDIDIEDIVTREEFEKIIAEDLVAINELIDKLYMEIGLRKIDYVVTTGGSSLIPAVQNLLKLKFGEEKVRSKDTFTSVARGLALRAPELIK